MSHTRIAWMALLSVVILAGGLALRHRLRRPETEPTAVPSEASAFQQLSERAQLQRTSRFVAERVAAVAAHTTYVASVGASGVWWGTGDSVLTTAPSAPIVAVFGDGIDSSRSALRLATDSMPGEVLLVVGRTPAGRLISQVATGQDRMAVACNGDPALQYALDAPLDERYAGAGLFDLDGRIRGMVVRCDGRVIALMASEVDRLLAQSRSTVGRLRDLCGLVVASLDDRLRAYFHVDHGLVVTGTRAASPIASGLRPGDLVIGVDGRPAATLEVLSALIVANDSAVHTIVRRRGNTETRVSAHGCPPLGAAVAAEDHGLLIAPSGPAGVRIEAVRAGSAAAAAGLMSGDRVIRIGDTYVTNEMALRKALSGSPTAPLFVVFERGGMVRGVLVDR